MTDGAGHALLVERRAVFAFALCAAVIVWVATLPDGGSSSGFLRDGHPLEW